MFKVREVGRVMTNQNQSEVKAWSVYVGNVTGPVLSGPPLKTGQHLVLKSDYDKLKEDLKQIQGSHKRQCDLNDKIHAKYKKALEALKLIAFKSEFIACYQDELRLSRKQAEEVLKELGVVE